MPGTLFVVATPIGNLEDISARALRILREVAVIAAEDTRRTAHLLARYAITTPTTSLHGHNEAKKTPALIERLQRGDNIALVSDAGTPGISDPGQGLVRTALDAGVKVEPIPGPSAVMAALAVSGFPTSTFTFLGFPPIRLKDRNTWFSEVLAAGRTVVFFEAPHRIRATLEQLLEVIGNRSVVICRETTKAHEQLVKGPISTVLATSIEVKGEFTVVIDIGDTTKYGAPSPVSDGQLLAEFGQLTKYAGSSKRHVVNMLARKHGRAPNEVYAALERGRKSTE